MTAADLTRLLDLCNHLRRAGFPALADYVETVVRSLEGQRHGDEVL